MKVRLALVVLASTLALPAATHAGVVVPGCADATHAGGEWRSYGGGLNNARNQTAEGVINSSNVRSIAPLWVFDTAVAQAGGGSFSNTPVLADGCVFLASNTGWVYAINADTGEGAGGSAVVWKTQLSGAGQQLLGGVIVGSPVVENGIVYVGVSKPSAPYVAALDEATGRVLWFSTVEVGQQNALINASPVYFDPDGGGTEPPLIFMGFAGNEGGAVSRGGFAIVDASRSCEKIAGDVRSPSFCDASVTATGATGGRVVEHTYTITDAEWGAGYRGASVWCTAAIDLTELYAYACGGNPSSKKLEARYSNALLKIDVNPNRSTFGEIVDAYKGDVDQYYPGLDRQPVCDQFGDTLVVVWSLACLQLDLDFGSSPNIWHDSLGRLIVGDLQKSGVYHAVFTDHMQKDWTSLLGLPCQACNAASPAWAGDKVFSMATPGGQMMAITREQGRYRWAAPVEDGIHFESVATANGVVYTMDAGGGLNAFDAETGLLLIRRPLTVDTGAPASDAGSQGVSIARNTILAATGQYVVAYR